MTTLNYDYSVLPLGRLASAQVGSKTSTLFHYFTSGLMQSVETPTPGTSSTNARVTTSYTYSALGTLCANMN